MGTLLKVSIVRYDRKLVGVMGTLLKVSIVRYDRKFVGVMSALLVLVRLGEHVA